MNRVFLNGQILDQAQALVPLFDRGLLYGDGLFETLRVRGACPSWWERHLARLQAGAEFLRIQLPFAEETLRHAARQLIEENAMPEAVLRITLTRGVGRRGYSPKEANQPMLAMTMHPLPPTAVNVHLVISSFRVPRGDPLARFKTANKLVAVLARAEAERRGADEALLLNTDGDVAEATASNVFWLEDGTVCSPPLSVGVLPGVARAWIFELCRQQDWRAEERIVQPERLRTAQGIFLTNSVAGVVPVSFLDQSPVPQSERVSRLQHLLEEKRAD